MPTKDQLADIRATFEAARSFEDTSDWLFTPKRTPPTRCPTLTTAIAAKSFEPGINSTLKRLGTQAIKPKEMHTKTVSASKLNPATTMKWEPTASWEPAIQYQKDREYAPGVIQGTQQVDQSAAWMNGWRFDEYGKPVKIVGGEEVSSIERVQARIAERSGRSLD